MPRHSKTVFSFQHFELQLTGRKGYLPQVEEVTKDSGLFSNPFQKGYDDSFSQVYIEEALRSILLASGSSDPPTRNVSVRPV